MVHNYGQAISQAIGSGGHDLSANVGGIMFLQHHTYLANDPDTHVIVFGVQAAPSTTQKRYTPRWPRTSPWSCFSKAATRRKSAKQGHTRPNTGRGRAHGVALLKASSPDGGNILLAAQKAFAPLSCRQKASSSPSRNICAACFAAEPTA